MNSGCCEMVSFAAFSLAPQGAAPPPGSVATPSTDAHTTIWSVPVVEGPAMKRAEASPGAIGQDRRRRRVDAQRAERRRRSDADADRCIADRNPQCRPGVTGDSYVQLRVVRRCSAGIGADDRRVHLNGQVLDTTPAGLERRQRRAAGLHVDLGRRALAPSRSPTTSAVTPVRVTLAIPAVSVVATADDKRSAGRDEADHDAAERNLGSIDHRCRDLDRRSSRSAPSVAKPTASRSCRRPAPPRYRRPFHSWP